MANFTADQLDRIRYLYARMPNAPMPPYYDGETLWGDVEGNDYWAFCEAIVKEMDQQIGRAINSLASAHNLV